MSQTTDQPAMEHPVTPTANRPLTFWKEAIFRFVIPIAVALIVGFGSSYISVLLSTDKLESLVDHLEVQIERHEKALDRDFLRHEQVVATLSNKTDDQERRLTRLEALVNEAQSTLAEIRSDIKTLLRGSGGK